VIVNLGDEYMLFWLWNPSAKDQARKSETVSNIQASLGAMREIFRPDSAVAVISRGIATIGGGIAFGWTIANLTGSVIGGAIGLLAFLLSEKSR
jgi:hypothetical protein